MIIFKKNTVLLFSFFIVSLLVIACGGRDEETKPGIDSDEYKEAVSDFYTALAAIQSDQAPFAVKKMQEVTDNFSSEPAAWANLSVFAMRQGNYERATEHMNKALEYAPENGMLLLLSGLLESQKGNIDNALLQLQKAAKNDSTNTKILFALADELERQDPNGNVEKIQGTLEKVLKQDPDNMVVLLEVVRIALMQSQENTLHDALAKLKNKSSDWPAEVRQQFNQLEKIISSGQTQGATYELTLLRINLSQLPEYQQDMRKVEFPSNQVSFLITKFLWLPNVKASVATPDKQLVFDQYDDIKKESAHLYKPVGLSDARIASTISIEKNMALIDDQQALRFPGAAMSFQLPDDAIATIDYDYDYLSDLAFAGKGGFNLYRQQEDSSFTDVTDSLGLQSNVLSGSYRGVWTNDIDLDGDLDLLLAPESSSPFILRNNGDRMFDKHFIFSETGPIQNFLWADFDQDGDNDAVFVTKEGEIDYYSNERMGKYELNSSLALTEIVAADYGDLNGDGLFEIIAQQPGKITSTYFVDSTSSWQTDTLVSYNEKKGTNNLYTRLYIADLDNNAALDVLVSNADTTLYWLSDQNYKLFSNPSSTDLNVYGLADINGDTRLDMVGLTRDGQKSILLNKGGKGYKARLIRPRASGQLGDRRINSFGIGGEIEVRSGLQYTKQPINRPWVHFGLGDYSEAKMLRIIWPNGTVQAEFAELGYETNIMNEQILKGSCPWLLTYNGEKMEFVTDLLWRTALGLRINAQGKAAVIHSIDWVKVDGSKLTPRDGFYDMRITADLWETHFFDHVSLMTVDSPKNMDVFVDERFKLPAPEQKLYTMEDIRPVAGAYNYLGQDVSRAVSEMDGTYVDSLPMSTYQGLTKEHYVEVNLGEATKRDGVQYLIASGWIYPTDSSINVAISQSDSEPPHGIRVEVPNAEGRWKVAKQDIGFPAGKNKTMLIKLNDLFESNTERRVRLYTNMEIYWDQFRIGTQVSNAEIKTKKLAADSATLRYRGFSKLENKDRQMPTVPNYQQVSGTSPKWRDLIGFYTRFGDVKELMRKTDDRYVIMNAGDELMFKFPSLDEPQEGWERDFIVIGDGWVKDGDYNTGFSKTVLPLPYHGMKNYSRAPRRLNDDRVYQKYKDDWIQYHTRYITPQNFNSTLLFNNE